MGKLLQFLICFTFHLGNHFIAAIICSELGLKDTLLSTNMVYTSFKLYFVSSYFLLILSLLHKGKK